MEAQLSQTVNKFGEEDGKTYRFGQKLKQPPKFIYTNRAAKRSRMRINHDADRRPFARVRSGIRTGTSLHFTMWMADLRMHSILQRTKLNKINDTTGTFALLCAGGFKTLSEVTVADKRDLLAVKGIGPKRLEALKADLASHNVGVRW